MDKKINSIWDNLKNFGTSSFKTASQIGSSSLGTADNLTIRVEKANSGLNVGDEVIIKKGIYTGKRIKIKKFIVGGIEGDVDGKCIKIRHGSYDREEDVTSTPLVAV